MRFRFLKHALTGLVLPGMAWLVATAGSALGQDVASSGPRYYTPCPPPPCQPAPMYPTPSTVSPGTGATPEQPGTQAPPTTADTAPSFSPERSVALGGTTVARSAVGYIDTAIPMSQ